MADTFLDLGLSDAVAEAARAAGYERPTALQAAATPVVRRGGNVVLHAATGAGVTAAFGLGLLDRLAGSEPTGAGPRALVLAPTRDRAEALAQRLARLAGATGIAVRAAAPGWRPAGADVLVTTAQQALAAVQKSALKLESLQAAVIVDAAELYELGGGAALGTLAGLLPKDAQRVVTSAELGGELDRFIEAHVRRAFTVPARAADPTMQPQAESRGQIGYMVVPAGDKPEMLARLLEGADEALVYARTAARAEQVMRELAQRGVADGDGLDVRVASFASDVGASARIVSYDVPFSAEDLRRLHETGGTVLVTPAELTHFRRIAAEAPFTLKHRRARELDDTELEAFRSTVRAALSGEDLSAQLLVLEPLLDDHAAVEVAAALSALLRRRTPAPVAAPVAAAPAAATGAPPKDAAAGAFTRLFISLGSRDNIRPGDLVGAITGEANIKGEQVGRVDIRDSFSVVEVEAPVAEKVIRALNGTTMRGRSLRVDFDRKPGAGGGGAGGARGGPGPRGPGGPRRPSGGAPRRRPRE